MRADAQRNRERLLEAAIALILEVGREPTRESIAARADLGIGTLYRHFPDQQSLLQAVVHHALIRSIAAGEAALADAGCSIEAVRQYMHAAVDAGLGVVNIIHPLLDHPETDLRRRAESMIHELLQRGRCDGRLQRNVTAADIVYATIRFSRPLAVGLSAADERAVAHRHIDHYVNGLRVS